jgi:hypothetical protein
VSDNEPKKTRREQRDTREDAALFGAFMAMCSEGFDGPKEVQDLRIRVINGLRGNSKLYKTQLELYLRNERPVFHIKQSKE